MKKTDILSPKRGKITEKSNKRTLCRFCRTGGQTDRKEKMLKKMILCAMLLFAVGSTFELSAQENITPSIVDQIVRKLGRGISNVAFGALEFPIVWHQVNFEEGGLAACTYGILRGVVAVVIREVVGVVEIVTFPFPLPGCSELPDCPKAGYGPIIQPEWILTPAQNKYNFVYPNTETLP